jgi:hypothetical protein
MVGRSWSPAQRRRSQRDRLDSGITLVDVGEHRLRDLDRPERVFQACADGLERQFPPLRSLTNPLRGFPAVRTRIIGRDRLLAAIADRLGNEALVTLTGVAALGRPAWRSRSADGWESFCPTVGIRRSVATR